MKISLIFFIILIFNNLFVIHVTAQSGSKVISGKITTNGIPVPFANVGIYGTTLGTVSDEKGEFRIDKLETGSHEIRVSYIGYENWNRTVTISKNETEISIRVNLKPSSKLLDEIVITGTRGEKRRLDSAIPVNILTSKVLEATQSLNLSEGLSFQPGIRIEKDCQTCNFTQVRMNGLPGAYSQILINSRPLFSSLAGLYGLEQLPTSMIDRVEIVKGGGSVLYGSNAIAGTINIITKDPDSKNFELGTVASTIKGESSDFQTDFYSALVNRKSDAGLSLIISHRNRESWDANQDGFSELASMKNLSFGVNSFIVPDQNSKIRLSLNSINEIRNGGDRLNQEPHLRMQSEFRDSRIIAGNADFIHDFYKQRMRLEIYSGAQLTSREHYTGSFGADGYGTSKNRTMLGGIQLNYTALNFPIGKNVIATGLEYQYDYVFDEIKAYHYLINQETYQTGFFLQSDWEPVQKINLVSGIRISTHNKAEEVILSPRISVLYKLTKKLQARLSWSKGFRAPQAFDTDMHIAFSGGGVSLTTIDPNLQSEKSNSYNASMDYNFPGQKYIYGFTLSSFFTQLENTFILQEQPNSNNTNNSELLRTNGSDSKVWGLTAEARVNYNYKVECDVGLTYQQSTYAEPVSWSAEIPGTTKFLRTPQYYGYITTGFNPGKSLKISVSGVYTGMMLVPHFAGAPGVLEDQLVHSPAFMEINLKSEYQFKLKAKLPGITLSFGVQNILDQFQQDFDTGPSRDSNYIYGPGRPRTYFIALKLYSARKSSD